MVPDFATNVRDGAHAGLRGASLTKELDLTPEQWQDLLRLTGLVKHQRRSRSEPQRLRGRNIALVFAKTSTRTRCAFEVAAYDQGAHVTYLDPEGSQLGRKESIRDTARVLGRLYDGIEYRGFAQVDVEELARSSGVPVWNGLSDQWHPTQSLCDMFTMIECASRPRDKISFAFVGDGRNNVARSLLVAGAMSGMDVRIVAPAGLSTPADVIASASKIAARTGATITCTDDPAAGLPGAEYVYTDVWVSLGEREQVWAERVGLLAPYQVNEELLELTARPDTKFMHCLPAFHDRNTTIGEQVLRATGRTSLEVTDAVFESSRSIVFDQAENRLHSIKAVLVATLGSS